MTYNNSWLIEKYQSGQKIKFIFFWGHTPTHDGSITKSCLSQWWEAPFTEDGIDYKTAEHWMMACKAKLFDDAEIYHKIIIAETPAEAKKLGRLIKDFDPVTWDLAKIRIVVSGNYKKFLQNDTLKDFLINTRDRVLVEASPADSIWGVGMSVDNPKINDPLSWRGENLLGYALMEVRDQLK